MNQQRSCFVCGAIGLLTEGPLPVEDSGLEVTVVAQCPRCQRFFCTRHTEPQRIRRPGASYLGRLFGLRIRCLCCPFDPSVPLGVREV